MSHSAYTQNLGDHLLVDCMEISASSENCIKVDARADLEGTVSPIGPEALVRAPIAITPSAEVGLPCFLMYAGNHADYRSSGHMHLRQGINNAKYPGKTYSANVI